MTVAPLTTSPTRSLTTRLGELKEEADQQLRHLEQTLRHIDETRDLLNQHGLHMTVDLGTVGNAAAVARRQVLAGAVKPTFQLPRTAA